MADFLFRNHIDGYPATFSFSGKSLGEANFFNKLYFELKQEFSFRSASNVSSKFIIRFFPPTHPPPIFFDMGRMNQHSYSFNQTPTIFFLQTLLLVFKAYLLMSTEFHETILPENLSLFQRSHEPLSQAVELRPQDSQFNDDLSPSDLMLGRQCGHQIV